MGKIELLVRTTTQGCASYSHQAKAFKKAINTGLLKQILRGKVGECGGKSEFIQNKIFMEQNECFGA